jgi:AGCS family alanine or glycine:cation symporter
VFLGAQLDLPLVWAVADLSMAFMTMVNLVAVLLLTRVVIAVMRDYNDQLARHAEPVFHSEAFPAIARRLVPGAWDDRPGRTA